MQNDLTGQRFGRLVAIRLTDKRKNGQLVWECKCDCGKIVEVIKSHLLKGSTKSCGCLQRDITAQMGRSKTKDLTGQRFGRLVVVRLTDKRKNGRLVWECKCDCGNVVEVQVPSLLSGDRKSCGCLAKESRSKSGKSNLRDLTGQRFGNLVVIRLTNKRKKCCAVWECICDCGNKAEVSSGYLFSEYPIKSCGCLIHDKRVEFGKSLDHAKLFGLVEDTSISFIKSKKTRKDSKTGHRGVYYLQREGKYVAHLTFKKKRYDLGHFDTIAEAIEARKKGEEDIFEPFVKMYEERFAKDKE